MDSAELMVLKPRKASPLTGGEYAGVLSFGSARTVFIDGNKKIAKNSVPAKNLDMMELEHTIRYSLLYKTGAVSELL
jgi:hypothetical protein